MGSGDFASWTSARPANTVPCGPVWGMGVVVTVYVRCSLRVALDRSICAQGNPQRGHETTNFQLARVLDVIFPCYCPPDALLLLLFLSVSVSVSVCSFLSLPIPLRFCLENAVPIIFHSAWSSACFFVVRPFLCLEAANFNEEYRQHGQIGGRPMRCRPPRNCVVSISSVIGCGWESSFILYETKGSDTG